jgi:hypothetical protein
MTSEPEATEPTTTISPSGDERVDAVLAGLTGLAGRPVAEHVGVFAEVHQGLQEILNDEEDEPGEPPQA